MPAMTKEQYWKAGAEAAAAGRERAPFKAGTWQAAAYDRGYRGVPLDGTEVPKSHTAAPKSGCSVPPPPIPGPVPEPQVRLYGGARAGGKGLKRLSVAALQEGTSNWPSGARQHALRVAEDMNRERDPKRNLRLYRALQRMHARHGAQNAPYAL